MTVYGYLRVSTDGQDCDNQKIGVEDLARTRGLSIENWIIDDGVSGTKEPKTRLERQGKENQEIVKTRDRKGENRPNDGNKRQLALLFSETKGKLLSFLS